MNSEVSFDGCFGLSNGNLAQTRRNDELQQAAASRGDPTPQDIDSLIAKEMTKMSMQERENAMEEVHGIAANHEEDAQTVISCLEELDAKLNTIKRGTAYELAEAMSRPYVMSQNFRMMFIRADRYDIKEAAERMIRFFELKRSLFGTQKLVADITIDDLNEDDKETLVSGAYQISPFEDTAGRPIVVNVMTLRKFKTPENVIRAQFYVFMSAVEKAEHQKRGIVAIYYVLDSQGYKSVTGTLRNDVPVHFASIHLCYNDMSLFAKACVGIYALKTKTRVRYRPHFGSHIECQYALTTFGIPRHALPVSAGGEANTEHHQEWLKRRLQIEAEKIYVVRQPSSTPGTVHSSTVGFHMAKNPAHNGSNNYDNGNYGVMSIVEPSPNDVLFGRGKTVVEYAGNARFRNDVDMYMHQYEAASRMEKTQMADIIVKSIKDSGGRFLKREGGDGGVWEEVNHTTARKKVAHAFRNRRKFHGFFT